MWGWQELALRVRTGDIATDLIRPIHPIRAGLATDYGRATYQLIFRGIPPVAVGVVAFHATLPSDPLVWIAFLLSLVIAIAVSFGFRLLYTLAAFWTTDTRGTMILALVVMSVFSGFTIPIQFFPAWLAAIAYATPFPAMIQTPVDIFVGAITGPGVLIALGVQLAWAVALLAASYGLFALGTRRLVVQGG
jgi:ABC-2 type transport system permease protein